MFPKKLKQSGLLYKKAAKLEEQLEKEWALQNDHAGPSNQSPVVQSAEDVAMSDPYEEPMASMEEEYLNENGDDDDRISDEGSIHNEDTDGEEYLEGEFLEEASLEIDPESAKLRDSLRTWLIRNKVARSGSNSLLAILRKASSLFAFSFLPQDVRTLLKAPVNVSQQITKVPGGGEMWYQGVECCFQHYFRGVDVSEDEFELNLSVDGIPIYNRSAIQMWPILMQLHNMPNVPIMVVGIFCGTSKPSDVEPFLRPLVEELNRLHDNKMTLNGKKYLFRLELLSLTRLHVHLLNRFATTTEYTGA